MDSAGMLRPESKARARALQLLYAWELQGQPPIADVADRLLRVHGTRGDWSSAERMAAGVAGCWERLDAEMSTASEHWRLPRMGIIERNIIRLALFEFETGAAPVRVVISEALRLTHWFAGARAGPFVNGVLDALARQRGRL